VGISEQTDDHVVTERRSDQRARLSLLEKHNTTHLLVSTQPGHPSAGRRNDSSTPNIWSVIPQRRPDEHAAVGVANVTNYPVELTRITI